MDTYEVLSLLFLGGTFLIAFLAYLDNSDNKRKKQPTLSANRIGGVLKDIHQPKLGASTFGVGAFCLIRDYEEKSVNNNLL